jgi:c-di-AMP phosphodiesterase-like protein
MNQKHLLQMLAVCFAVIVMGIAMVTVFGVAANSTIFLGLLVLCPLSHLLMMRTMGSDHDSMKNRSDSIKQEQDHSVTKILNENEEKSHVQNCH